MFVGAKILCPFVNNVKTFQVLKTLKVVLPDFQGLQDLESLMVEFTEINLFSIWFKFLFLVCKQKSLF